MRGNRVTGCCTGVLKGSIPACAGEPIKVALDAMAKRVYPRVCGGTNSSVAAGALEPGLSPRVRGNLWLANSAAFQRGSIPACAGEPSSHSGTRSISTVYPRVCGGTADSGVAGRRDQGLSPRVRGNP